MNFKLVFTSEARDQLAELERTPARAKQLRAVRKTLGLLETNLRHPSLKTHEFHSLHGVADEKVFEAYAENRTPGAFRVFWHYGPGKAQITIVAITPHP